MKKTTKIVADKMVTRTTGPMPTFRNYREPTNRATSDTEASSTGNHIGDLYRRHRMNQAEAQNDAWQNWFQNAREQQTRD